MKIDEDQHIRGVADSDDVVGDALYYRLYAEAENVRWRLSDIPWHQLNPDAVSPFWKETVKQVALSELATFDGAHQFMQRFGANADFSQWIAVWLYEETKHPQVLMTWLHHLGVHLDSDFLVKGRESSQFASSWLGTLTLNLIAEVMATEAYYNLAQYAPEPVLKNIATRIAGDEARHASHFFAYGRRLLERCPEPDLERKNALEVLFLWLNTQTKLEHPIGQAMKQIESTEVFQRDVRADGFVTEELIGRICKLVGLMIDLPLHARGDVVQAMRTLIKRMPKRPKRPQAPPEAPTRA